MENFTVYCSQPASGQMAPFLLALRQAQGFTVRPVTELPGPDHLRRQQLRTERVELEEDLARATHALNLLTSGRVQPDAGRENGLRFDTEALRRRLVGITTVLGMEKGAADNA